MSTYNSRPITEFDIPASEGTIALYPEQAILKCGSRIDIGALCYLDRSNERRERGKCRMVALHSFDKSRAVCIQSITNRMLAQSVTREISVSTVEARGLILIRFLDWCDSNGHKQALESIEKGREAFRGYVAHLRHLFDVDGIQMTSVYTWQRNLISILNPHFEIRNIELGTNLIMWDAKLASRTEVPTQDRFARFVSLHVALFEGLSNLVLDNEQFPCAVEMPTFTGYNANTMWLFPSVSGWTKHPETSVGSARNQAYDYVHGRIKNFDEVHHLYIHKYSAEACIEGSLAIVADANANTRHPARIRFASLANQLFFRLFEVFTGANRADVQRIEWTDDLAAQIAKPDISRQGFRSLKVRANNREVFYQVGITYLPFLRKFLKLRSWLLDGATHDLMFFFFKTAVAMGTQGPRDFSKSDFGNLEKSMCTIYPSYNQIRLGNRKTRATKQDDVIRHFDPVTGAKIMQHNVRTAIKAYSNGSSEHAQEEMGDFLQKVHSVTMEGRHHRTGIEEERATGSCTSMNQPRAIIVDPPIMPDCKRSEGCLFCDKYRAHTDEKDVRKLLSAKNVIDQTSKLASSAEEYDRVFGATLERIDQILIQIHQADASMENVIERVRIEVARGEMDPYWTAKVEELIELGIV